MSIALMLRTSNKDRSSHDGFIYPESGIVEAPDWDPRPICGGGLHGFLWGEGDGVMASWKDDAVWQVISFEAGTQVVLKGKIKIPRGEVVFSGDQKRATDYLLAHGAQGKTIIGAIITVGDKETATVGYGGIATAGAYGYAIAGACGWAIAGDYGTATVGNRGTATAGNHGKAIAGDYGVATVGEYGTAMVGNRGCASAGKGGIIKIRCWDLEAFRSRIAEGHIGENGIKPDVTYTCNEKGELLEMLYQENNPTPLETQPDCE